MAPPPGNGEAPDPLRIVRADDLLVVTVHLRNLVVSPNRAKLTKADPGQPAHLVFELPPQHQAEQAYLEWDGGKEPAGPAPIHLISAGPSRLAFELPGDAHEWPLDMSALLDWSHLTARLPRNALPPDATNGPGPAAPADDETAIELPYRLILSPDRFATWSHRQLPFGAAGRTELWHTVLRYQPTSDQRIPLRAIAYRDVSSSFTTSLTAADLADLVTLTGDFANQPRPVEQTGLPEGDWLDYMQGNDLVDHPVVPTPLRTDHVLLGPLGANLRAQGHFTFPTETQRTEELAQLGVRTPSLLQYEHVIGSGRDQFVKVVRRGYVHTGQRACIIKTTYRTFEAQQVGNAAGGAVFGTQAYLRQNYRVVILEPVISFAALAPGYNSGGREMPLRSLTLTTLTTPKLDLPLKDGATPESLTERHRNQWQAEHPGAQVDDVEVGRRVQADIEDGFEDLFWITAGGKDALFSFTATDWEEQAVAGSMPLIFVPYKFARTPASGDAVANFYELVQADPRRTVTFDAQRMAIADPTYKVDGNLTKKPGSTTVPVDAVAFGIQPLTSRAGLPPTYLPWWLWRATNFNVHLETAERLTGHVTKTPVTLNPTYLSNGLERDTNPAGAFAALAAPVTMALGGTRGGGLAQPQLALDLLSSRHGLTPAALLRDAQAPPLDLSTILAGAKLLGVVDLASIIGKIPAAGEALAHADDIAKTLDELPTPDDALDKAAEYANQELQKLLDDPTKLLPVPILRTLPTLGPDKIPTSVETRFIWKPPLNLDPALTGIIDVSGAQFVLDVRSVASLGRNGGKVETRAHASLSAFSLIFANVVKVNFGTLEFTALPGRKPDVTADGVGVDFINELRFVNTLRDIIPAGGFSDPPAVAVTPYGISAGFSLAVPTVGVGIFSLQNLTLSAALSVPFIGKPAGLRFAFSEREHPFLVTVTLFGGGGFFALGVSANGLEEVEAAIEFGGNVSLNLGVASGGVYVMAGVYFALKPPGCTLTGYLRCGGYLSVLGLVSISIEFYLAFTWQKKDGGGSEIWGQASLTVKVKVACFSKSVTLSVERHFSGGAGDPTLGDVLSSDDWLAYCHAYALEGP